MSASSSDLDTLSLASVHTSNLPALFARLRITLVVSTYQAGKVILVRADGDVLNTHFRALAKPMGVAADTSRLTIGGAYMVWYYRNMPAVAAKIEPPGKYDACYLPRGIPFRTTKAERLAAGDPRRSLEERYKNHDGYVKKVTKAARKLEKERLLLPEDVARYVDEAAASTILR